MVDKSVGQQDLHILYICSQQIEARRPDLEAIWSTASTIPATLSVHSVRTVDFGHVLVSKYTKQPGTPHTLIHQPTSIRPVAVQPVVDKPVAEIRSGSYVALPVATERGCSFLYVATVSHRQGDQVQIKFLRKVGSSGVYKDADHEDNSLEDVKTILFVCPEPQVTTAGARI